MGKDERQGRIANAQRFAAHALASYEGDFSIRENFPSRKTG